jgi:replication factor C subunit 2/4
VTIGGAQLNDLVVNANDFTDKQKAAIGLQLARVDRCLVDGADEYLQLLHLCAVIMNECSH